MVWSLHKKDEIWVREIGWPEFCEFFEIFI